MTAFIHRLPASAHPWVFGVEFDYSVERVDAIKQHIPSRQRAWKPEIKQWWFRADVILAVCSLADKHCGRYVHVEELYTDTPAAPIPAYAALHLLPPARQRWSTLPIVRWLKRCILMPVAPHGRCRK